MKRKLVTLRKIHDIQSIKGADFIELAKIDGWQVVVKKNDFRIGDLCVYFEIDSFLPIKDEYEFLRKSCYKKLADGSEGFRLKTIALRGEVSQGLVMTVPDYIRQNYKIGDDLTDIFEVVKYEPPIPAELAGIEKGPFPGFIFKTDEHRIQNLSADYDQLTQYEYYISEKLDGTSATFFNYQGEFGVCSRNIELCESDSNTLWKIARLLDLRNKMKELGNIAIQGEIVGENVQGNVYKLLGQHFKLFRVFDIDKTKIVPLSKMQEIASILNIDTVPILQVHWKLPKNANDLIEMAQGKSVLNSKTEREGIVLRSMCSKVSFKVLSNKYLINNEQ